MKTFKFLATIILLSPVISYASYDSSEYDDWIECSSKFCSDRTSKLCEGYYQEPEYPFPTDVELPEQPTLITSDETELRDEGLSVFKGNVVTNKGNKRLIADQVDLIRNKETNQIETIHATGNVKITEPGLRIDGTRADLFSREDKKVIYDAKYRMYDSHVNGTSSNITTYGPDKMELPNVTYTTCAPKSKAWRLKAKKVKLNKETGRGEAWHAKMHLRNIPIFYWPYINFPLDDRRQTGFLQPSIENSSRHGSTLIAPFYWNLAPNYDATITPYYMSNRGLKLDNLFRYISPTNESTIKFNYLPQDRGYNHFRREKIGSPGAISSPNTQKVRGLRELKERYLLSLKHKTKFNKNLILNLDYTRAGDNNYLQDFDKDLIASTGVTTSATTQLQQQSSLQQNRYATPSQTNLLQKADLQYRNTYGNIIYKLEQYQTLHPFEGPAGSETFRKLPEVSVQSSTFDLPYEFTWQTLGSYTHFKRRENIPYAPANTTVGKRYHVRPELSYPINDPGWFLRPRVQLDIVNYDLTLNQTDINNKKPKHPARTIPMYNIDSGLIFERELKITKQEYIQTLEPRAYFLYVPKRDQTDLPTFDSALTGFDYNQVFRDNRYGGFDRVSEAYQLGLGLKSIFFPQESGTEKASLAIGRIRYFQDRTGDPYKNASLWSPIAAQAKYEITPFWTLEGQVIRNTPGTRKTITNSANIQYHPSNTQVLNIGYQFSRNETIDPNIGKPQHIRQTHTSAAWEVGPHLRLLGALNYDLTYKRAQNIASGFEVHSCCTIFRVTWARRFSPTGNSIEKKYENILRAQFVFKGFAGVGNMESTYMSQEIPGYIAKDHQFK